MKGTWKLADLLRQLWPSAFDDEAARGGAFLK